MPLLPFIADFITYCSVHARLCIHAFKYTCMHAAVSSAHSKRTVLQRTSMHASVQVKPLHTCSVSYSMVWPGPYLDPSLVRHATRHRAPYCFIACASSYRVCGAWDTKFPGGVHNSLVNNVPVVHHSRGILYVGYMIHYDTGLNLD